MKRHTVLKIMNPDGIKRILIEPVMSNMTMYYDAIWLQEVWYFINGKEAGILDSKISWDFSIFISNDAIW